MDPIIIVPVALAVAWAATRKKKTATKPKVTTTVQPELPSVVDEPELPSIDDPVDGPGGEEPWRPGGPNLPKPPPNDAPYGPKPFPGPSGGPKPPELGDPSPTEIHPGATQALIEDYEHAFYGLFISSDCSTVFWGDYWLDEVFLPQARELVLGNPEMFHDPVAVIYQLLVQPNIGGENEPETPAQACVAAWEEFVYGAMTPYGTFSGWHDDPYDEYWDYFFWFSEEYPEIHNFLWGLHSVLWDQPDLAEVFDQDWGDDYIDFGETGT